MLQRSNRLPINLAYFQTSARIVSSRHVLTRIAVPLIEDQKRVETESGSCSSSALVKVVRTQSTSDLILFIKTGFSKKSIELLIIAYNGLILDRIVVC